MTVRAVVAARAEEIAVTAAAAFTARVAAAAPPVVRDTVTLTGPAVTPASVEHMLGVEFTATVWQWQVGEPQVPFEPHHELDGIIFGPEDRGPVAKDPGDFPFGNFEFFPQDHSGCRCTVATVSGEPYRPPVDAPVTVTDGDVTVTVTPTAEPSPAVTVPAWWANHVTAEAWAARLAEAVR